MNVQEKNMTAGNLEKELQEIVELELVDEEVVLSFTSGYTDFLTIICC